MKAISFLFICILSASAQAQQSVKNLSQDVNQLVQKHIDSIPERDRQDVRRSLRRIIETFEMNGIRGGSYGRPVMNLFCDSSDNTLRDLNRNGALIYDFSSTQNCTEAKDQISYGEPFCDYSDNTLRNTQGSLIYDFADSASCQKARKAVLSGANFCDYSDNTLRNKDGGLIYDFSSAADCDKALDQSR